MDTFASIHRLTLLVAALFAALSAGGAGGTEPVYWRQNLFSIPYEWNSANNASANQSVRLFVSKDRGASWQPLSDAQSQLLAFNYHAEADGEYWFAIRTAGAGDRDVQPSMLAVGSLQPELRVVVDTTMPRFESLSGQLQPDGSLEARWRVADANLNANSASVEVQDASGNWQPLPLTSTNNSAGGLWDGTAKLPLTAGVQPIAVRATVIDLAGNRAVYQSTVLGAGAPAATSSVDLALAPPANNLKSDGWTAASTPSAPLRLPELPPESQQWPVDRSTTTGFAERNQGPAITYGDPATNAEDTLGIPTPTTEDRPLGNVPPPKQHEPFVPIEPFRQVSMSRGATGPDFAVAVPSTLESPPKNGAVRLVNSRTFSLEYQVADVGPTGVARVTLWGTRDGGQSWQRFAQDDDNRSPLTVTVDGDGEYGFRIVVDGVDGLGDFPPQPGDKPELVVGIDLERPQALVTSVTPEHDDRGPEAVIRWEADDDNLEPQPISLFYSSRPTGPWTTIATSLENSGEFRWPVERHVPRQVYLRLEVRDTAGNLSVFQTREPVFVEPAVATHAAAMSFN